MSANNAVKDYWEKNVANWKIASDLEAGSEDFFKEVERYRFDKLHYLPNYIDYNGFSGKHVLDVGCGLGTDLSLFAKGGANVSGVDIAPQAIHYAKENFAWRKLNADLQVMDGEALGFDDNSFDFIYCHTVLHFTSNPADMIAEIKRVLKPGGQALLMTINRASWLYALHKLAGLKIDYLDAPVFHRFNYGEFEQLLAPFNDKQMIVERFPVRTEVHSGIKAMIYNHLFVDLYNAMPKALIGKTGYHLLALVTK